MSENQITILLIAAMAFSTGAVVVAGGLFQGWLLLGIGVFVTSVTLLYWVFEWN